MEARKTRRRVVVDNSQLARTIGGRIRQARKTAGLTQSQLAGDRYTKAYISALESGISKPSMAALDYLAPRLGTTSAELLTDASAAWSRLEADLLLASGDWKRALSAYRGLLERQVERGSRAALLTAIAECLCRLDRPADAIRPAADAAEICRELGRPLDEARARYWLASAQHQQDNPDEARSILRGVVEQLRSAPGADPDLFTRSLIALAMVENAGANATSALGYLEEARTAANDLDDRRRGTFLTTLAETQRAAGDHEGSIRAGLQALALLRSAQSQLEVEIIGNNLALTYLAAGSLERARSFADEARAVAAARGDRRQEARLADTQAQVALATGDVARALVLAREAGSLAGAADDPKGVLDALVTEARSLVELGQHDEALAAFERAATLSEGAAPGRRREILSAWADSLAQQGRHDEAYRLARQALSAG
jgi:tetratricopeptide (TPR) repeat protein